jgi:hypothetical protein
MATNSIVAKGGSPRIVGRTLDVVRVCQLHQQRHIVPSHRRCNVEVLNDRCQKTWSDLRNMSEHTPAGVSLVCAKQRERF